MTHLKQHCDDQRLQTICNPDNRGFAAASNQALPLTQCDYLLFLNPDCVIAPDTLQQFSTVLDQYSDCGMAGALVKNPDGTEQAGCRRSVPSPWRSLVRVLHLHRLFPKYFKSFVLTDEPMPDRPIEIEGISGACMFVRHEALRQVGAMDEEYFLHCEDLDWFWRFRQQGWKILFVPQISVMHVKGVCSGGGEALKVLWYKHRGMIRFYHKFFRQQYPIILYWGVIMAVWVRFALLAVGHSVLRLFRH